MERVCRKDETLGLVISRVSSLMCVTLYSRHSADRVHAVIKIAIIKYGILCDLFVVSVTSLNIWFRYVI